VRYDGVRFTVFNTANSKGINSNHITALFEDHDGNLWIGAEDGRWPGKEMERSPATQPKTVCHVTHLIEGFIFNLPILLVSCCEKKRGKNLSLPFKPLPSIR
jgi:hypothetical protein